MDKVVREGKVAVLYSPGFGEGWYSWNTDHPELLFHPKLVEMVESENTDKIDDDWIKDNLGLENIYYGGVGDLTIKWLEQGTHFDIHEYDGSESIVTFDHIKLIA